jgi:hypothetical protein
MGRPCQPDKTKAALPHLSRSRDYAKFSIVRFESALLSYLCLLQLLGLGERVQMSSCRNSIAGIAAPIVVDLDMHDRFPRNLMQQHTGFSPDGNTRVTDAHENAIGQHT